MSDLSDIRREYTQGGLRRANLPVNPMDLFEQWMQQAKDAQLSDPTAMCVATVDEDGQPFQRIVLLK
ncbi:MAG TPA: pyridoxamine 5'-phosphate oxidase, partial [Shewanella frigidimarina]|nr:pyridoxamine 5'-phosphate oxidase [Shewanella frigidimarina]